MSHQVLPILGRATTAVRPLVFARPMRYSMSGSLPNITNFRSGNIIASQIPFYGFTDRDSLGRLLKIQTFMFEVDIAPEADLVGQFAGEMDHAQSAGKISTKKNTQDNSPNHI